MIENISINNPLGIYCGKYYNMKYFFFQNGKRNSPTFPSTCNNQHEWDLINALDKQILEASIERIFTSRSRARSTKKRCIDEIDHDDNINDETDGKNNNKVRR